MSLLQVDETEHVLIKFRIIYEVACEFVDEDCPTRSAKSSDLNPVWALKVLSRLIFSDNSTRQLQYLPRLLFMDVPPSFDEPQICEWASLSVKRARSDMDAVLWQR